MSLRFQWDPRKAASNEQKHGVSFEEAFTVFDDPLARIFDDHWHSEVEFREMIIAGTRAAPVFCWLFFRAVQRGASRDRCAMCNTERAA